MKQTPQLDQVQARMQPGVITLDGFLGADPRKLADILAEDAQTVAERGVTHAQIARRLRALTEAGRDLMEEEVEVEGRYRVTVRDDRGVCPSPWGDGNFGKGDVQLADPQTGRSFRWNELSVHMVEAYGFYSGRGSSYRLDPAELIATLELRPEAE